MPANPQKPKPAPNPADLPHPLTFFLTSRERAAVLRALRERHQCRARALLLALNLETERRP